MRLWETLSLVARFGVFAHRPPEAPTFGPDTKRTRMY
jgi:hypothetical protein